jgi:hypothetical protein
MAETGLFIGWGAPVRGREAKGLEVFNESIEFYGGLQGDGRIESFEVVVLYPHGGDLYGFALLRGSQEQVSGLQADEGFQRLMTRASLIVERLGVVNAALGDSLGEQVNIYQQQVSELT